MGTKPTKTQDIDRLVSALRELAEIQPAIWLELTAEKMPGTERV